MKIKTRGNRAKTDVIARFEAKSEYAVANGKKRDSNRHWFQAITLTP